MQQLQEIFNRIQEAKKKQKDLRETYKDALAASTEYQEIIDKMKTSRERKKQIETTIRTEYSSELTKLDDLDIDIKSDMEMLTDIAITQLAKGEEITVKDEYDNTYEPVFKVNFKKSK